MDLVCYPDDIRWWCAALRWPLRYIDDKDDMWIELTRLCLTVLDEGSLFTIYL